MIVEITKEREGWRRRRAKYVARKMAELNKEPAHLCPCGCGLLVPAFNKQFIRRLYAKGHSPSEIETRLKAVETIKNNPRAPQHCQAISKALKGKAKSPEAIENHRLAVIRNGSYKGENNPFYGKKHSLETRQKISCATSQRNIGANNPNWHGGISALPYGPEFTERYKKLIRQRDKNRCQRCGRTRKQEGKELAVHHIDHDKTNNDPMNLVAVCSRCNTWLRDHREESLLAFPKRRMLLE